MLCVYGHYIFLIPLVRRSSILCRREILTIKVGPRAERVNVMNMNTGIGIYVTLGLSYWFVDVVIIMIRRQIEV